MQLNYFDKHNIILTIYLTCIIYITDMLPQYTVTVKKLISECFKYATLARNDVAP